MIYKILLIYICCALVGLYNKLYKMHGTYIKIFNVISSLFWLVITMLIILESVNANVIWFYERLCIRELNQDERRTWKAQ